MECEKIKVIHFLSTISISSGVASVIMNYYRYIDREKIQFDFIYFDDSDITYEKEIKNLGGKIYKVTRPSLDKKFFEQVKNIFNKYDGKSTILHNHELYLNVFLYKIAKKSNLKAIIGHSHTTKYSDKFINSIRNKILCSGLHKKLNYLMACSKAAGITYYGREDVEQNKVFILNNAINYNKFKYDSVIREDLRKKLNLNDKFVVGHVGRFNKQKNHKFILEVFKEIISINQESVLMLIGEGPMFNEIVHLSETMNIKDNILFLGRKNNVNEFLQVMDCFLLPSLYEGLPVIGVEAQASGLQCFMSNNITNETDLGKVKFLSLNESAKKWAEVIMSFNYGNRNESLSNVLIESGFDIENEVKRLENFYFLIIED